MSTGLKCVGNLCSRHPYTILSVVCTHLVRNSKSGQSVFCDGENNFQLPTERIGSIATKAAVPHVHYSFKHEAKQKLRDESASIWPFFIIMNVIYLLYFSALTVKNN